VTQNPNFKDLLSALNDCNAKYLVVGGYAVMIHSEPRYTKDLDIWVEATPENALLVYRALAAFGAPLAGIRPEEFAKPDVIYQLGVPPSRIDVLTSISGVEFAESWPRRFESKFGDLQVPFISLDDLIRNKRSVGRHSDLADCERLEQARSSGTAGFTAGQNQFAI
jgi:hypothetical protein